MNLSTLQCIKILILRLFLFYMFTHIHMHVLMTKSMYKFIEILSVPHCNSSQNLIQGFAHFTTAPAKTKREYWLCDKIFLSYPLNLFTSTAFNNYPITKFDIILER